MTEIAASVSETPELIQVQEPKSRDERKVSLLTLCGLALVIGVMTGLGAVAFRALIGFVHNAFYNGMLSFIYDANVAEAPSRFGDWVFFSPVIGGLARRLYRQTLCAGGQGSWRSRGDGRGLLQARQHPRQGGDHQGAGLGAIDRQRRCGRAAKGRSSRSARRWAPRSRK